MTYPTRIFIYKATSYRNNPLIVVFKLSYGYVSLHSFFNTKCAYTFDYFKVLFATSCQRYYQFMLQIRIVMFIQYMRVMTKKN